jgi:hypothetical protein
MLFINYSLIKLIQVELKLSDRTNIKTIEANIIEEKLID